MVEERRRRGWWFSPVGTGRGLGQSYQLVVIKVYFPSGYLALWLGLSQAPAKAWMPHSSASKPGAAASSRWNDQGSKGPGDMWRGRAALPSPHPALDSSQPAFPLRDEIFMSAE